MQSRRDRRHAAITAVNRHELSFANQGAGNLLRPFIFFSDGYIPIDFAAGKNPVDIRQYGLFLAGSRVDNKMDMFKLHTPETAQSPISLIKRQIDLSLTLA